MNKNERLALLLASSVLGGGVAAPAWAQATAEPPAAEASITSLDELVVTARRREERLLDVPVSIAAIGGDELQARGAVSGEDFLRGIPGVGQSTVGYQTGQSIVIRGIETVPSAQNFGVGPTYASYFGETPTTLSAGVTGGTSIDLKLIDIDRVEVLRGPQGTAFGDAALGGAVRALPRAAKLGVHEAWVQAEYSNTGGFGGANYSIQGVVNIPLLEDRVALRAVAYRLEDSGFYRNRAGSSPAFQSGPVTQYGVSANAEDRDRVGDGRVWGGRLSLLFAPSDDLRLTLNLTSQRNETDGIPLANSGRFEQTLFQVDAAQVRRGERWGFADQRITIVNPVATYDLGWADLVASYSHMESGSHNVQPYGVFGLNLPISQAQPNDHEESVGEVRITTKFDGALNIVAGLFAERIEDSADLSFYWFGSAASSPYGGVRGRIGSSAIDRELVQKSAYGQVFWEVIPDVTLTAGARYYDYDREYSDLRSGPLVGNSNFRGKVGANGFSPHVNLSYKPTPNHTVYASYSEGFRLGTPQATLPVSTCDRNGDGLIDGTNTGIASTGALSTDEIKNYELGAKGAFLNGAAVLDVALFRMKWSGVPVRVLAPSPCNLSYQANAGDAESEGVEVGAALRLSESLKVRAGLGWTNARLTEDVPALGARAGNQLPGAAKVNGSLGVQYDFLVGDRPAYLRADATYVGATYGNLLESPSLKTKPYATVDLTAGVTLKGAELAVFVRNLGDEDTFASRGTSAGVPVDYGYRLRPRTVGVRLGYRFGE